MVVAQAAGALRTAADRNEAVRGLGLGRGIEGLGGRCDAREGVGGLGQAVGQRCDQGGAEGGLVADKEHPVELGGVDGEFGFWAEGHRVCGVGDGAAGQSGGQGGREPDVVERPAVGEHQRVRAGRDGFGGNEGGGLDAGCAAETACLRGVCVGGSGGGGLDLWRQGCWAAGDDHLRRAMAGEDAAGGLAEIVRAGVENGLGGS